MQNSMFYHMKECNLSSFVMLTAEQVFHSCRSTDGPVLLTAQGSGELWVEFASNNSSLDTAQGFQLSLVSVTEEVRQIIGRARLLPARPPPVWGGEVRGGTAGPGVDTVVDSEAGGRASLADTQLVRHIIKLLSSKVLVGFYVAKYSHNCAGGQRRDGGGQPGLGPADSGGGEPAGPGQNWIVQLMFLSKLFVKNSY